MYLPVTTPVDNHNNLYNKMSVGGSHCCHVFKIKLSNTA